MIKAVRGPIDSRNHQRMSVTLQFMVRRSCVLMPSTSTFYLKQITMTPMEPRHLSISSNEWIGHFTGTTQSLVDRADLSSTALEQLGLYTWWRPSAWYRVGLEVLHTHANLSWLVTIICGTVIIRLALVYMPVLASKRKRKVTQLEQLSTEVKPSLLRRHNPVHFVPGAAVFLTQYGGLKKMAEVSYTGWSDGGVWSFTNLSESDPFYVLPAFTAVSILFLSHKWARLYFTKNELKRFGPELQYLKYPAAFGAFLCSSQVPAALCLCWFTSSVVSNVNAAILSPKYLKNATTKVTDEEMARFNELLDYVQKARSERVARLAEAKQKMEKVTAVEKPDEFFETDVRYNDLEEGKDNAFSKVWQEETNESYARIQRHIVAQERNVAKKDGRRVGDNLQHKLYVEKVTA